MTQFSGDRLHDFEVLVGSDVPEEGINTELYQSCYSHEGTMSETQMVISCANGVSGSVLVITIPGSYERLTLCEVQVYKCKTSILLILI